MVYREGAGEEVMMTPLWKCRVDRSRRHAGRNIQYAAEKLRASIHSLQILTEHLLCRQQDNLPQRLQPAGEGTPLRR